MKFALKFCVAMSIAAFGVSALVSSCVNPEYELSEDNINTDITIAQDGLVLPLGKTAPITLGELYDKYGQDLKDYLQNKDGKYVYVANYSDIDAYDVREIGFDIGNGREVIHQYKPNKDCFSLLEKYTAQ